MASRLAELLDSIDPHRTLDEVARRADEAINSFISRASLITDWDEFRRCVVEFHRHVEGTILRLRQPVSGGEDFDWGRTLSVLTKAFGPNGEKAAFEMARTGTEGSLNRVLRDTAKTMATEYAESELAARINSYWNDLSTDEKLAAPDEYLERFSHLLPSELTEGGAWRVRANFPKVLQEHSRLIQRLSQIGRT
jgi:hypothetical protein